jgi:hypothetical protein
LGDLVVVGRITLKYIFLKQYIRMWTGCKWLKQAPLAFLFCEGRSVFDFIKVREFLYQSLKYWVLKKGCAP